LADFHEVGFLAGSGTINGREAIRGGTRAVRVGKRKRYTRALAAAKTTHRGLYQSEAGFAVGSVVGSAVDVDRPCGIRPSGRERAEAERRLKRRDPRPAPPPGSAPSGR
jgi:hypothetical protein